MIIQTTIERRSGVWQLPWYLTVRNIVLSLIRVVKKANSIRSFVEQATVATHERPISGRYAVYRGITSLNPPSGTRHNLRVTCRASWEVDLFSHD